jgi:hypothetical protein
MRLIDLVKKEEDALLHHPTLGFVRWRPWHPESDCSRLLVWACGPEQDDPLVVDDAVLFCDLWEITTEQALQDFVNA